MFDAADTLSASIQILEGVMATLEVRPPPWNRITFYQNLDLILRK
jgi:hypothetical protein